MERLNIRDWQKSFINGEFDLADRITQIKAGWYDWFCRDTSLRNKTIKLGNIIKRIKSGGKADLEKNYVFFKNNCPCYGGLYDDFRICDIETRDVQLTISVNCSYENARYTVYGRKNNFEEPIFKTKSVRELVKWINTPWEVA